MSSQPSLVTELCDFTLVSISAGSYHSAAVDEHGSLWTWGWGVHGQLGLGDIEDEYLPRRVLDQEMNREAIVQVEAGYAHTVALTGIFSFFRFSSLLAIGLPNFWQKVLFHLSHSSTHRQILLSEHSSLDIILNTVDVLSIQTEIFPYQKIFLSL